MKLSIFFLVFLLWNTTWATEIYLNDRSPTEKGFIVIDSEKTFSIQGVQSNSQLTNPWFQALPLDGRYTVQAIEKLENDKQGWIILLQAQTGKAVQLQRLRGQGGLIVKAGTEASGFWRSRDKLHNSFGVLFTTQEAMVSLAKTLKIGETVMIHLLSKKAKPVSPLIKTKEGYYWRLSNGQHLPWQTHYDLTQPEDMTLELLRSEHIQVMTVLIPETVFKNASELPSVRKVLIQVWRLTQEETKLLQTFDTNTNSPYIAQTFLDNPTILSGDHLLFMCTELFSLKEKIDMSIDTDGLTRLQKALSEPFTLTELQNHLQKQKVNKFEVPWLVHQLQQQHLTPLLHKGDQLRWFWSNQSENQAVETGLFYPWIRLFIYRIDSLSETVTPK